MPDPSVTDNFTHPCLACGSTIHVKDGTTQPHNCDPQPTTEAAIAKAYWAGYDNRDPDEFPDLPGDLARETRRLTTHLIHRITRRHR